MTWVAQWSTGKWYWIIRFLSHLRESNALLGTARGRAGMKGNHASDPPICPYSFGISSAYENEWFCSICSYWIFTTVSSLPLLRTCSFRGPHLFDKLAAKPPAPQGYRPRTRSKPNMSLSEMIVILHHGLTPSYILIMCNEAKTEWIPPKRNNELFSN